MRLRVGATSAARRAAKLAAPAALLIGSFLATCAPALADSPSAPTINEPSADNMVLNPADVHMEASGFADTDGDTHVCSDWEIWTASPPEPIWQAICATGTEKVHIHLGDGDFVNSHAGRSELHFDTDYRLHVRFRDSADEVSSSSVRPFSTSPPGVPGNPGAVPWAAMQPQFKVELVASGFQLPVNVAPVPAPGDQPDDPLLYVSELYGSIKVVTRGGTVSDYASDLLNFNPTGNFPGSGEQGVTGIVVDPETGDVFASMVYEDISSMAEPKPHYPKVVRFHSHPGGLTAESQTTVIDMAGEYQGASHQISNLTFGPDGMLYVHNGDGFDSTTAQDLDLFRGKVLRITPDGLPAPGNPFFDEANGITPRDYVFAYGFRNPFGGAWRAADGAHYTVENGPSVDRFAKVVSGTNYLWDGSNASMLNFALYNWDPSHAPVNIAFVEPQTASGSGFPAGKMDHAFVTESGPTYATGPQERGKRIVEFIPDEAGESVAGPFPLVEYTGIGKATAAGLAAGTDGLYFTDLYKDLDYTSPIDPGANLLLVKHDATPPDTLIDSGPSDPTNDPTPSFSFSSDEEGSSFECRLDSSEEAAFQPCPSPHSTDLLPDGPHSFEVRATDAATNTDPSPASRIFTVDTDAPDTLIDSGPSDPTNDPTPSFSFSSGPGASFECRLDGGGYSPCGSPFTTAPLTDGPHRFEVRATDEAANTESTPAGRAFTVDTQPPDAKLSGKGGQEAGKAIEVEVSCPEDCAVVAAGKVLVGGGSSRRAAARSARKKTKFGLDWVARGLTAGETVVLKLRPRRGRAGHQLRRLVGSGRKARAGIRVKFTDRAGNSRTARMNVRLRRKPSYGRYRARTSDLLLVRRSGGF